MGHLLRIFQRVSWLPLDQSTAANEKTQLPNLPRGSRHDEMNIMTYLSKFVVYRVFPYAARPRQDEYQWLLRLNL